MNEFIPPLLQTLGVFYLWDFLVKPGLRQNTKTLKKIVTGKAVLYSVQIEYEDFHGTKDPIFVIHFHRRKGWTPFGFQKTVNSSYKLSHKHSFRVFQLLNSKAKFIAFHMHRPTIWIVSFEINWYVHSHI